MKLPFILTEKMFGVSFAQSSGLLSNVEVDNAGTVLMSGNIIEMSRSTIKQIK
jgi:hypothetical protein